ncbi:MAG TPA: hypothetical protein VFQ53_14085 [Kofleriaceae bacterium]|nr:hypothetical protein [Kofleriaceae bacterium]
MAWVPKCLGALAFVVALTTLPPGCRRTSVAEKFCLGAEGTYQDCAIACDVTSDEDSCAKWAMLTRQICEREGKQPCQELCLHGVSAASDARNPTACELVKQMK